MGLKKRNLIFKLHTVCRACGFGKPQLPTLKVVTGGDDIYAPEKLIDVMDLGPMPLANDFKDSTQVHSGWAPLTLKWCPNCSLAQLSVVVDPKILYSNYAYVTSHSDTMREHFRLLLKDLVKECDMGTVVEIGSNDGTFLKECTEWSFKRVIGIEPAINLCETALKKGIETRNKFFCETVARELSLEGVDPDLIVARHVFCHIDDWQETIHALGVLACKNTVVAIEVPYFVDTMKNVEWDQLYHEHLSYMTVKAMKVALEGSQFHIHAVNHYAIHGGAIVILLRRKDCGIAPKELPPETIVLNDLHAFRYKADSLALMLRNKVLGLVGEGRAVVGYGASAKATQWIHACGFTKKQIQFVCDETLQKQYKMMPGTDIPVVHPSALTREIPDYCVCFAWNFFSEIYEKEKMFRDRGGKWLIPVPELKVV